MGGRSSIIFCCFWFSPYCSLKKGQLSWGNFFRILTGDQIEPRWLRWRAFNKGTTTLQGFPGGSDGWESAYNEGDLGLIPDLGRSPGEENGNPLQYSCLENSTDRGTWWATFTFMYVNKTWVYCFHIFFSPWILISLHVCFIFLTNPICTPDRLLSITFILS